MSGVFNRFCPNQARKSDSIQKPFQLVNIIGPAVIVVAAIGQFIEVLLGRRDLVKQPASEFDRDDLIVDSVYLQHGKIRLTQGSRGVVSISHQPADRQYRVLAGRHINER